MATASSVTTQELGYLSGTKSNVQTQLDGKVNKNGDTMTGELLLYKGYMTKRLNGNSNNGGYINIVRIKIKRAYMDFPLVFELSGRGWQYSRKVYVIFQSINNIDPNLGKFLIDNPVSHKVAIIKREESTWDIYVEKDANGSTDICKIHNTVGYAYIEIECPNTIVSELPTGYILPEVITWDKANTANKLQTARKIKLTGAVTGEASFDGSGDITIETILGGQ